MKKIFAIGLCGLLFFLSMAAMGEQKPDAGALQQIKASILIVDSKDAIANWAMNPAGGDAGRIRSVPVGQKLFVPVVVTGLQTTDFGRPGIIADMQFISPDGKVFFNGSRCCSAILGDPRTPGLAVLNPVLDLTFDAGDPLGTYEIRATVTYNNSTARTSEKFALVAGE